MVTVKTNLEIPQKQSVSTATLTTWVCRQDLHTGPEQRKTNVMKTQSKWELVMVYKRADYLTNLQDLLGFGWHFCKTPLILLKRQKCYMKPCCLHDLQVCLEGTPGAAHNGLYMMTHRFQPEHPAFWGAQHEAWKLWKLKALGSLTCAEDYTWLWPISNRGSFPELCNKLNTSSCCASI